MSRTVLVANAPAPYRIPVFDRVSDALFGRFHVIYCASREPNRKWDIDRMNHEHTILKEVSDGYVHNDHRVLQHMKTLDAGVVITGGFSPSFLFSFAWSQARKRAHIPFTDGTIDSEQELGAAHRLTRKMVYLGSTAFIGASDGSLDLYRSYGVAENLLHKSILPVDLAAYARIEPDDVRPWDVVFSGQLIDRKMPDFFVDVCASLDTRIRCELGRPLKVLVLGDGPLRRDVTGRAASRNLDIRFEGFVSQDRLPKLYGSARVLLFPTRNDPWGVVAAEAMAAGTPVITCANAGVAGELVVHDRTGLVIPLEPDAWELGAAGLLLDGDLWRRLSESGRQKVANYNYDAAARGIVDAVEYVGNSR